VARGKLQLVQARLTGDLQFSGNLAGLLSRCALCGACEAACPAEVPVTEIVLRAREKLLSSQIFAGDAENSSIDSVSRWARYLQAARSSADRPLLAIMSLFNEIHGQPLPIAAAGSLSEKSEKQNEPMRPKMRVGYFPGCAQEINPRVSRAVVDILRTNGVAAFVPGGLSCCGWPFLEAGDFSTARKLARQNIGAFEGWKLDAIVTDCASGARVLRRYYQEILGLGGFEVPVYHIAEFLAKVLPAGRKFAPLPLKAALFSPIEIGGDEGWFTRLSSQVPELELVEVESSGECFGESLFFSVLHPEIFQRILKRKLEAIAETGCGIVITDSPICAMQLEWGIRLWKMPHRAMHTAQVLAGAWGVGDSSFMGLTQGRRVRKKS
jgi:glycolate oxidase iron-sulfur subunit